MVSIVIRLFAVMFILLAASKAVQRKSEWMVLLLIMSLSVSALSLLFLGQETYTLFWIKSIQFHVDDIVLFFLFIYCCILLLKSLRFTMSLVLLIALIILPLAISVLRGLFIGAFQSSKFIADTRQYGSFILPFLAFYIMIRNTERAVFEKSLIYIYRFMNCLAVYLVIIWILDLFFGVNSLPGQLAGLSSDGGSTFRVIPKPLASMMAFYVFILAYDDLRKGATLGWKTLCFSILVILLQLRVVQVAFLFGCFLLLLRKLVTDKKISAHLAIQVLGMFVAFLVTPILFGRTALLSSLLSVLFSDQKPISLSSQFSKTITDVTTSFTSVANNTGTYATRTHVWDMILGSLSGIDILLGQPFGTPYAESVAWIHSPHSQYVSIIFKEGYFGLLCFITFLLRMIVVAARRHLWIVVSWITFLIIYFYTEGAGIFSGAVLGTCLGILEWPYHFNLHREITYGNH